MEKKIYIKDESFDPIYREVSRGFYAKTRIFPSLLFFSGLFVFATQVLLPVLVFKTQDTPLEFLDNTTIVGRVAGFSDFRFEELKTDPGVLGESDYIEKDTASSDKANVPESFYLSIPKLKIEDAVVHTNSPDLNPSSALGHYPGTALPGENGNAFIYGHSVLPWFFNPKNYKTIFSTLNRLEPGDEFYITYNNRTYTYAVETTKEVQPNQVDPLAEVKPKFLNESTVVLMTCSPPGTKLRRLLVSGVLID